MLALCALPGLCVPRAFSFPFSLFPFRLYALYIHLHAGIVASQLGQGVACTHQGAAAVYLAHARHGQIQPGLGRCVAAVDVQALHLSLIHIRCV